MLDQMLEMPILLGGHFQLSIFAQPECHPAGFVIRNDHAKIPF